MEQLVSIIVPIYNAEQYLEKCILSIVNQSYKNLQIILVDDGSTDSSLEICEKYRLFDKRIEVIHKKNGGVVSARKAGVVAARGILVGWIDADDWIEADYFEKLVDAWCSSGADIVAANHFHDTGTDSKKVCNNISEGIYSQKEILSKVLYAGCFFEYGLRPHLWTKLMCRELLYTAQMNVDERIVAGDDVATVYASVLGADKICITDICGYHYVQHPGAITKTESPNEMLRIKILIEYLQGMFTAKRVEDIMQPQLEQYKKYLLFLRNMSVLDIDNQILLPYGGIQEHSKVVIYGAGVSGQKMYKYLSEKTSVDIVLWLDRNYENYQKNGCDVRKPEDILEAAGDYDYVLVANTVQRVADAIKRYLVRLKVPEKKIRWFSKEFLDSEYRITI